MLGIVFLIGFVLLASAHAAPNILYDSGRTNPIGLYVETLRMPDAGVPALPPQVMPNPLPVRTPGVSPGPVRARPVDLPQLPRPLFLIGADELSKAWLARHRAVLKKHGAVGLLIQAASQADLDAIAALADGLPIVPASAADLMKQLRLQHYPVLISRRRIEQ